MDTIQKLRALDALGRGIDPMGLERRRHVLWNGFMWIDLAVPITPGT